MIYKFRAWDKQEEKMIDAESLAFEEYQPLCISLNDENIILMPYINFNDETDKEIYVGDIIEFQDCGGEGEDCYDFINKAVVCIDHGRVELTNWKYDDSMTFDEMNDEHYEFIGVFEGCKVVGNIYENKELVNS